MKYKSIAQWRKNEVKHLGNTNNISEDTHDTKEQAEAVCRMLERDGFGGNGQIFPIRTWIEPVGTKCPNKNCRGFDKGMSNLAPLSKEFVHFYCHDCRGHYYGTPDDFKYITKEEWDIAIESQEEWDKLKKKYSINI